MASESKRPLRILAVLAVIVAFAIFSWWSLGDATPRELRQPGRPPAAASGSAPFVPRGQSSELPAAARTDAGLHVRFVDDHSGSPVGGVVVLNAVEGRLATRTAILATSGEDGSVALAGSEASGLRAVHRCYEPLLIPHVRAQGAEPVTVELRRGNSISVLCRSQQGQVVPGVPLVVSRVILDDPVLDRLRRSFARGEADWVESGSASSVRVEVTEQDGTARFRGLPSGRYVLRSLAEGYAVVAGQWYRSGFEVPDVAYMELTIAPLLALSLAIEGDELIDMRFDCPEGLMTTGTLAGYDLEDRQREGKARARNGIFLIGADCGVADRSVSIDAFFRKSGKQTLRAEMEAWRSDLRPRAIHVEPGSGDACGMVQLRILNPNGADIDIGLFAKSESVIPITGGATSALPPGEYRLFAPPILSQFLGPTKFSVASGEATAVEARLTHNLVPVVPRLLDASSGEAVTSASLAFEHESSKTGGRLSSRGLSRQVHWLPEGIVKVRASTFGYSPAESSFVLEPGHSRETPQIVEMQLVREQR